MKITLSCIQSEFSGIGNKLIPKAVKTHTIDGECDLEVILEEFEYFIRAIGYNPNGTLMFAEE